MEKHYEYKNAPQVCSETISFDYIDGKIFHVKIRGGCIGSNLSLCKLAVCTRVSGADAAGSLF